MATQQLESVCAPNEDITALLSGGGKAIPLFKVYMSEAAIRRAQETMASGYIGQGPRVDEFEQALVPWFGRDTILTTNAGTSAIQLALRLANVAHGDDVISTPMTCTATNVPILAAGANIIWGDIDPMTGNLDPEDVAKKITPKTKAIVCVDWGGNPNNLAELQDLARAHNIKLIEDAAHAFGATYQGKPVGSHADYVTFSFQAIKHLTTVDGGAIVCADPEDYKRGKLLRWYGIDREGPRRDFRCEEDVKEYGYKFHMNDVAAATGLGQLETVKEAVVDKHKANGRFYRKALKDIPNVTLLRVDADRESAYWLFTIRVKNRLKFMQAMQEAGVVVSQVHARNDHHTMVKPFQCELPGVDAFTDEQVSIPVGWWLTEDERAHVAEAIRRIGPSLA